MKSTKWLVILIGLLFFIYFMPRQIVHSEYSIVRATMFLLIFGLVPYLVFKTTQSFDKDKGWSIGLAFASILIVGVTFSFYNSYREKVALRKTGLWTKCLISQKDYTDRKGFKGWTIKCTYQIDKKLYETDATNDIENKYKIGDTLDLIYLKDYPRISVVGYEWKK